MPMTRWAMIILLAALLQQPLAAQTTSARSVLSLDGNWDIEDSVAANAVPTKFTHSVPVPGLAHLATPAFADVDKFQSKQTLSAMVYYGLYKQSDYDRLGDVRGIVQQSRSYFWYRTHFRPGAAAAVALLKISKAQFGTVVYLNGKRIGEHDSCFTAAYFDVSRAVRWNADNELIVRVGAHPAVLPPTVTGGTDFEKSRWTPGIYDSVALITANNPVITSVQAAPRLAGADNPVPGVLVQTELHNYSGRPVHTQVQQQVFEWKSGHGASEVHTLSVDLKAGETRTVTQTLPIPQAHLWSPEDPFLYRVQTRSAGDDTRTRFGMREFHFDTVTQRGYLNGQVYYLRGSNIALHRFFEDAQSADLPWNEAWVRRLLIEIPRKLHWNVFRFSIGPVPERWLEIADEEGMLIEYEYAVWVGSPVYTQWRPHYDNEQMIREYTEWLRDSWNHPSIFLWDATNESFLPDFASTVLPAVRDLDLSRRPWENNYNEPGDPNDPLEDHTYFLESVGGVFDASQGGKPFELQDLEWMDGAPANPFTKSGHAKILNEYGWMWLNRDGSPTLLTRNMFAKLLGETHNTVENRRRLYAQVVGAETELWRAYRRYAGVMHFVYLTSSGPDAWTSDEFLDLRKLELEPNFEQAMSQAFKPLGVYLNFWHTQLAPGQPVYYEIHMVNDESRERRGRLKLQFTSASGAAEEVAEHAFALPALGAQSYTVLLNAPRTNGDYVLKATAVPDDATGDPTVSQRPVHIQPAR